MDGFDSGGKVYTVQGSKAEFSIRARDAYQYCQEEVAIFVHAY